MRKVFAACMAVFLYFWSFSARADLIVSGPPTLTTPVLTFSSDPTGALLGTVGGETKQVGDRYDSLNVSVGWDPLAGAIDVDVSGVWWHVEDPSFVGAPINGFSVQSPDWGSYLAFSLGAQSTATGLVAYVLNPFQDVSYFNNELGGFWVLMSLIAVGDGNFTISLDNAELNLFAANGVNGGTAPEPGVLALVAFALMILWHQRRTTPPSSRAFCFT